MQEYIINGGRRLCGTVSIHGAKNGVLPVISASLLMNGESVLHNCPELSDVSAALKILESLGIRYSKNGSDISIFSKKPERFIIPDELMCSMRSSVMFLGSILARCGRAVIGTPGGCMLGPRPIDIHISALKKMGAAVKENRETLEFIAEKGLKGAEIYLDFPSVGATENIIMAAVLAKGTTTLHNAAREPEICDLIEFLNCAGAEISADMSGTVTIRGVSELGFCEHTVIPDRIEAATYMAAAAATAGSINLMNVEPSHLSCVTEFFLKTGCDVKTGKNSIALNAPQRMKAVRLTKTEVYPGFPTDVGPLAISALCFADGLSVIKEGIFQNRYIFAEELSRFGANIDIYGNWALVDGVKELSPADCNCTDLRGGAALVIAALGAKGESRVGTVCHIKRGYQSFAQNLRLLGADIREV